MVDKRLYTHKKITEKLTKDEVPSTARNKPGSTILFEENGFHSDRPSNRPITGGRLVSNKRILGPIEKKK